MDPATKYLFQIYSEQTSSNFKDEDTRLRRETGLRIDLVKPLIK